MKRLSIVITTCGRPAELRVLLESMVKTGLLKNNADMIVVDDGMDLAGMAMAQKFSLENDLKIRTFRGGFCGPSNARNIGITKAVNDVVVLLDDDVTVAQNYFNECIKMLVKYPHATLIGGKNVAVGFDMEEVKRWRKKWDSDPWMLAETALLDEDNRPLILREELFSSNMCLRKSHFAKNGKIFDDMRLGRRYGASILFGEDYELVIRTILDGKQVVYDPAMLCHHYVHSERLGWNYYWRRMALAGLEQRLIDEKNKDVVGYEPFRGQWKMVWDLIKKVMRAEWQVIPALAGKGLFVVNYFWGFGVFRLLFGF